MQCHYVVVPNLRETPPAMDLYLGPSVGYFIGSFKILLRIWGTASVFPLSSHDLVFHITRQLLECASSFYEWFCISLGISCRL